MLEILLSSVKCTWMYMHTGAHTQISWCYYFFVNVFVLWLTSTATHLSVCFLGGVLLCLKLHKISICFYLICGCKDHAWPMESYTVPRGCGVLSASEICLAFFFYFSSAGFMCFSSCVVSLFWIYLTEILALSIFCVLPSFKQPMYKKSEIQKNFSPDWKQGSVT